MTTGIMESTGTSMVAFGKGGLVPIDLAGAWKCAQLVSRSGLAPRGVESPEAILVAATMGAEIGLSFMQSLQNIAVINGRPSIWGDAALALVRGSDLLIDFHEEIQGDGAAMVAVCSGKRKGDSRANERRFSVADANLAGLWGKSGPWKQYPKRMLQMRARGFFLRDLFPDVLKGIKIAEEAMDIPNDPIRVAHHAEDFAITDDRKEQPSPEAPTDAVVVETGDGDAQPETAKQPGRRRRTVEIQYQGELIQTAGITEATFTAIMDESAGRSGGHVFMHEFIEGVPIFNKQLSYLREEEGRNLLTAIRMLPSKEITNKDEEPPATETTAKTETGPVDDTIYVECPDMPGDEIAIQHCEPCKSSPDCEPYQKAKADLERTKAAGELV